MRPNLIIAWTSQFTTRLVSHDRTLHSLMSKGPTTKHWSGRLDSLRRRLNHLWSTGPTQEPQISFRNTTETDTIGRMLLKSHWRRRKRISLRLHRRFQGLRPDHKQGYGKEKVKTVVKRLSSSSSQRKKHWARALLRERKKQNIAIPLLF